MDILLIAVLLGIVEGLTEFLPVSSTGHLILAGHWLGFTGSRAHTFEIFIQLGAILAVAFEYRKALLALVRDARSDRRSRDFLLKVGLAFLPAAAIGLATSSLIKAYLFSPVTVAIALVVGGLLMFGIETWLKPRPDAETFDLTWRQALGVGVSQVAALIPGMSRSASTIIGGMLFGLNRRVATEFSFYLALPTLGAATAYDLLKSLDVLTRADILPFVVGLVVSFVVALLVIRAFLQYVRSHDFRWMAFYRIGVGAVVLWTLS